MENLKVKIKKVKTGDSSFDFFDFDFCLYLKRCD